VITGNLFCIKSLCLSSNSTQSVQLVRLCLNAKMKRNPAVKLRGLFASADGGMRNLLIEEDILYVTPGF
jgi:hypothetical protein